MGWSFVGRKSEVWVTGLKGNTRFWRARTKGFQQLVKEWRGHQDWLNQQRGAVFKSTRRVQSQVIVQGGLVCNRNCSLGSKIPVMEVIPLESFQISPKQFICPLCCEGLKDGNCRYVAVKFYFPPSPIPPLFQQREPSQKFIHVRPSCRSSPAKLLGNQAFLQSQQLNPDKHPLKTPPPQTMKSLFRKCGLCPGNATLGTLRRYSDAYGEAIQHNIYHLVDQWINKYQGIQGREEGDVDLGLGFKLTGVESWGACIPTHLIGM